MALDVGSNAGLIYSYAVTIEPGALLDRALVRSRGTAGVNTTGCAMLGGTVRNTACLGSGPGTVNALTGTSTAPTVYTVRNVTAITTAQSGDGVRVGVSTQTSSMNVTNTIARGITSDVASRAGLATGDVTLTLDHSNWNAQSSGGAGTARIVPGAGNQYGPTAAVPLFADAAAGDYRIAAGSPTIDAGATDPLNGPLALGGTARLIGAATDMGAYEFVPPPPAPPAPPAAPSAPGAGGHLHARVRHAGAGAERPPPGPELAARQHRPLHAVGGGAGDPHRQPARRRAAQRRPLPARPGHPPRAALHDPQRPRQHRRRGEGRGEPGPHLPCAHEDPHAEARRLPADRPRGRSLRQPRDAAHGALHDRPLTG